MEEEKKRRKRKTFSVSSVFRKGGRPFLLGHAALSWKGGGEGFRQGHLNICPGSPILFRRNIFEGGEIGRDVSEGRNIWAIMCGEVDA